MCPIAAAAAPEVDAGPPGLPGQRDHPAVQRRLRELQSQQQPQTHPVLAAQPGQETSGLGLSPVATQVSLPPDLHEPRLQDLHARGQRGAAGGLGDVVDVGDEDSADVRRADQHLAPTARAAAGPAVRGLRRQHQPGARRHRGLRGWTA